MIYKKCPKCEINYIMNQFDEMCEECKQKKTVHTNSGERDNNKQKVEIDLLPILRKLSSDAIQALTKKKESFDLLGLRLPLLVECSGFGGEACIKEITTNSSRVYRYYVQPYDINGKKYHICSQWWIAEGNKSKDILNLLKEIKI